MEILGAKLLAPYLGTSHFVWTAQIGVTLVALAFGYAVGGRLADRSSGLNPTEEFAFSARAPVKWVCSRVEVPPVELD